MNYWDDEIKKEDPFTPFLRVTNSFNGARALRFDIGFLRKHCSNGVIFEEEVATIRAAHNAEALARLKIEIQSRSLPQMWEEFSKFLDSVREIKMSSEQSILAVNSVLRLPDPQPGDRTARKDALAALAEDFFSRLKRYRNELGPNAYAVFNTLTDIAARPPESVPFQKQRDTLEKRSGRWLKDLARESQSAAFDLDLWLSGWAAVGNDHPLASRN
mgnify:CR=1 FL=1